MIQVINRALNILEILAQEPDKEFGLSEIATAVELNAGTCANIPCISQLCRTIRHKKRIQVRIHDLSTHT